MWKLLQPGSAIGKIAASLVFGLLSFFAPQAGHAQFAHGGGRANGVHSGGGMGHFGGAGMPHFGGGGIPHFEGGTPGGIPHLGGAVVPFGGHPITSRVGHSGGPHIGHFYGPHGIQVEGVPPHGFPGPLRTHMPGGGRIGHRPTAYPRVVATNPRFTVAHIGRVTTRSFADRRRLLGHGPLAAFVRHSSPSWGVHHHSGWFGPIFWPYASGDFFYFALWPSDYAYYDPFWSYGYDDIYEGIFWPYDYTDYVRGRGAPARMRALTHAVAQSCADEAAEVTGWPIDQIQAAVQPSPQQEALLEDLGNAVKKASDVIKAHCPTAVSFTPVGRIAAMQRRLDGLVQAVNIVQPPLAKFYAALSDEQKARFNEIGAPSGKKTAHGRKTAPVVQDPKSACGQEVMAFPTERIDQVVRPDAAQRGKLEALRAASAKAADAIKAACPSTLPLTPPDRLAAEGQRLQAMLTAVETIRPPLDDFYSALSDEQKARFNTLGRRLFARQ